jgi:hypothetical protein
MINRINKSLKIKLRELSVQLEAEMKSFLDFHKVISQKTWLELLQLIARRDEILYSIKVFKSTRKRWSLLPFLKPKRKYAPVFDERIYTEKLLGKPSPGLSPPNKFSSLYTCHCGLAY